MGKWKYDKVINVPGAFVVREDMDMAVSDGTEIQCSTIVAAHNADCDAYEAELARVKAESLRVVPDGETCRLDEFGLRYFVHDSELRPCVRLYMGYNDCDFLIEKLGDTQRSWWPIDTIVQPVRLERWEAEE